MIIKVPSIEDLEQVRLWRIECLESLRTPFMLSRESQLAYYNEVVCQRDAKSRMWSFYSTSGNILIAFGGIENIEWENRLGEISLIVRPKRQRQGIGTEALEYILKAGFSRLNLENLYAEVYHCNPAIEFWRRAGIKYRAKTATLPNRKYWDGHYYHSLYINFNREDVWAANQEDVWAAMDILPSSLSSVSSSDAQIYSPESSTNPSTSKKPSSQEATQIPSSGT